MTGASNKRVSDFSLTGVGALGMVAFFVPFYIDISPYSLLTEAGLRAVAGMLAWPFLLALPIFIASVRWVAATTFTRITTAILYLGAAVSVVATVLWLVPAARYLDHFTVGDWVLMVVPVAAFGLALLISGIHWMRSRQGDTNSLVAAQTAFVANAVNCLAVAWCGVMTETGISNWSAGAYLTIVVCMAYILQIWRSFPKSS